MDTPGARGSREAAKAEARDERTLEGISCKALFGAETEWSTGASVSPYHLHSRTLVPSELPSPRILCDEEEERGELLREEVA
jgi:hypothetical protein